MTDQATIFTRYHAGPDIDDSPIAVTLPDGRVLAFVDYEYIRGHPGTRLDPPTPAEVDVSAAWWIAPDGTETDVTTAELIDLHDGPEYDAILAACEEIREAERAAEMDCGYEDEP